MRTSRTKVLIATLAMALLSACGAAVEGTYQGTKTSRLGSVQIQLQLFESSGRVSGTWTATSASSFGGNLGGFGGLESGRLEAELNGDFLTNVRWISNQNINTGVEGCSNELTGQIHQVNGNTLSGVLTAASIGSQCPLYEDNVTLNLTRLR